MTRRSSVRAQAQEIYREIAADEAAREAAVKETPTPDPSPQGGGEHAAASGVQTDLTARVRALYEGSAVPVREIAQLARVTERTLYRYVEKHGWRRRYRVSSRDEAVARANRGRHWRPAQGFAPAKGAGGRFIRRADKGKPFAVGLKATDPAGAARAAADCKRAQAIAVEAEHEARMDALYNEWQQAAKELGDAVDELQCYEKELAARPPSRRSPVNDTLLQALQLRFEIAGDWWRESGRAYIAAMGERPKVEGMPATDES